MLAKSLCLTADNITYDLEDSVTPHNKAAARAALLQHLTGMSPSPSVGELAVRINAVSSPYALDDLRMLGGAPNLDAILIPKVSGASDLAFVDDVLRHVAPHWSQPPRLIALIESAKAIMDLRSMCAVSPSLSGLVFAAEDFALDMSLTSTPGLSEFLYARSAVVTAARAYRLPSAIDLICTSYQGPEGQRPLEVECETGKAMGFNGKKCIHPSQLKTVHRCFAPEPAKVTWSIRVLVADDKAIAAGRGAWTLDGKMIDAPVVAKARTVVARAKRCGFDVEGPRKKWQHQEPE